MMISTHLLQLSRCSGRGSGTAPPPSAPAQTLPPQHTQALFKLVDVHHSNALLPWSKETATFVGHTEKVEDLQGRRDSRGRLLRRHSSAA